MKKRSGFMYSLLSKDPGIWGIQNQELSESGSDIKNWQVEQSTPTAHEIFDATATVSGLLGQSY